MLHAAAARAEPAQPPLNLPITFEIDRPSTVTVVIEDAAGNRVCNLASAVQLAAGKQLLSWDGYDDGEVQKDGSTIRSRVAAKASSHASTSARRRCAATIARAHGLS